MSGSTDPRDASSTRDDTRRGDARGMDTTALKQAGGKERSWLRAMPAKVAALVVFLVAVTTLLGNLMELDGKRKRLAAEELAAAAMPAAAPPAVVTPAPATQAMPAVRKLQLQLDRIAVEHNGGMGRPDWRFVIEADGQPLASFQQDDVDDSTGRNLLTVHDVQALMRLRSDKPVAVAIKGWRLRKLRGLAAQPDVIGDGTLQADGTIDPVRVQGERPQSGAFVFYLSADRQ